MKTQFFLMISLLVLLFGISSTMPNANAEEVIDNDDVAVVIGDSLRHPSEDISVIEYYVDYEEQERMAKDIYCLTEAILFEALHEPEEGQIAVANVILNRANWNETRPEYRNRIDFKSDVCGVVNFKITKNGRTTCAFSYRCEHSFRKRLNRYMDSESWNEIKTLAIRTYMSYYSGNNVDPSEGATHYHADYVSPQWRKTYQKTTKIGAHIFYKIPE